MRKLIIAGNWKMYMGAAQEASDLARVLPQNLDKPIKLILFFVLRSLLCVKLAPLLKEPRLALAGKISIRKIMEHIPEKSLLYSSWIAVANYVIIAIRNAEPISKKPMNLLMKKSSVRLRRN